jgi:ABC-type multidrug transport system ATPase subunit
VSPIRPVDDVVVDGVSIPGAARPVLDCRDLHKRFGQIEAVRDISFLIGKGETYGLLGPNGAGKTTTISIVCDCCKPTRARFACAAAR